MSDQHVDLGFLENCESWEVESRLFPSKTGGKPAWLRLENIPTIIDLLCKKCQQPMIFLCQIYAPYENNDCNFHRTLFVFICRDQKCCERNNSDNIKVFRSSLSRDNKFYSYDPPDEEKPDPSFTLNKWLKLCNLCGCLAEKHCSKCKKISYCSREHQVIDWKENHKNNCCKDLVQQNLSSTLFSEFLIVIEPEENEMKNINEAEEMEQYKKLQTEGKTGTLAEISEKDLDAHATTEKDKVFAKFRKTVDQNKDQVIRYKLGGRPLWIAGEPIPQVIPFCENCKSERQFEFQIMPQMLSLLKENDLDWGVIAVYTCKNSCNTNNYLQEFVFKQDISLDDNL